MRLSLRDGQMKTVISDGGGERVVTRVRSGGLSKCESLGKKGLKEAGRNRLQSPTLGTEPLPWRVDARTHLLSEWVTTAI